MGKLGLNIVSPRPVGFLTLLRAKPALVVLPPEQKVFNHVKAVSSEHVITILYVPLEGDELSGGLAGVTTRIGALATSQYRRIRESYKDCPADYIALPAVIETENLEDIRRIVAVQRAIMDLAKADGLKLCILNLASGFPSDIDLWKDEIAPFIVEAWSAGHIYGRRVCASRLVNEQGQIHDGDPYRPIDELVWLKSQGFEGGIVLTEVKLTADDNQLSPDNVADQIMTYERALHPYDGIVGLGLRFTEVNFSNPEWRLAGEKLGKFMLENPPAVRPQPSIGHIGDIAILPTMPTIQEEDEVSGIGRIIDVSRWQGQIDWDAFKADRVNYAFMRASSGPGDPRKGSGADIYFDRNVEACNQLDIGWGPYHFLYPGAIQEQVELFVKQTQRHEETRRLPPVLDVELASLTEAEVRAFIDGWNERVPNTPLMIYTNAATWARLNYPAWSTDHQLWVAHWTSSTRYIEPPPGRGPRVPKPWTTWAFWQWTSHGRIKGHTGRIDFSYFNGDVDGLAYFMETGKLIGEEPLPRLPSPKLDLTPYFTLPQAGRGPIVEITVSQEAGAPERRLVQLVTEDTGQDGNTLFFYLKGRDESDKPAQWEELRVNPAEGTIQRGRDTSHSHRTVLALRGTVDNRWSNWCPMKIGLGESYRQRVAEQLIYTKEGCQVISRIENQERWIKLVEVFKKWKSPHNEIVITDVIQLRWSQFKDGPMLTDYYFSADPQAPGLVGWDHYDGRSGRPSRLYAPGTAPDQLFEELRCL